jgi:hypothetical protein
MVLNLKRDEVGTLRNRLQIGLDKLMTTASEVAKLQEELTAMEPKLVATQKDVEEMIVTLEADKKTAAETKVCVCLYPLVCVCVCLRVQRCASRRPAGLSSCSRARHVCPCVRLATDRG